MKLVKGSIAEYIWKKCYAAFSSKQDVVNEIATHNSSTSCHSDIRNSVTTLDGTVTTVSSNVDTLNSYMPSTINPVTNPLMTKEEISDLVQKLSSASVFANEEMTNSFSIQSSDYATLIGATSCLESGPWFKLSNGVGVKCGVESGVFVTENDTAVVLQDETKFYFYADGYKFQRIKTGSGWGNLNLPNGSDAVIAQKPAGTVPITWDYPDTTPQAYWTDPADSKQKAIIYIIDTTQVLNNGYNILYLADISILSTKNGVVKAYKIPTGGGINDIGVGVTSAEPFASYSVFFPSSLYSCSVPQTETSAPKWGLWAVWNDYTFTQSQINVLNSGADALKIAQILTNKTNIETLAEKDLFVVGSGVDSTVRKDAFGDASGDNSSLLTSSTSSVEMTYNETSGVWSSYDVVEQMIGFYLFDKDTHISYEITNIEFNSSTFMYDVTLKDCELTGTVTFIVGSSAAGDNSISLGSGAIASGASARSFGTNTLASGIDSLAEGSFSVATGNYSHSEGSYTIAEGESSHAEGSAAYATGNTSHAEGNYTNADGYSSHAEGDSTIAEGDYSHAEGFMTTAEGESSHSGGQATIAKGKSAFSHQYCEDTSSDPSLGAEGDFSVVLGGSENHTTGKSSAMVGCESCSNTVDNVVLLGCKNKTVDSSFENSTLVEKLNSYDDVVAHREANIDGPEAVVESISLFDTYDALSTKLSKDDNLSDVSNLQTARNNLFGASTSTFNYIPCVDSSGNLVLTARFESSGGVRTNEVSTHDLRTDLYDATKCYVPIMSFTLFNNAKKFSVDFAVESVDFLGVAAYKYRYFFCNSTVGTTFSVETQLGKTFNETPAFDDVVYILSGTSLTFYKKKLGMYDYFINTVYSISNYGTTSVYYALPVFYKGDKTTLLKDFEQQLTSADFIAYTESMVSPVDTGKITVDTEIISGSVNPVSGGAVYTALSGKQDTLVLDSAPTEGSSNFVNSGVVYDGIVSALDLVSELYQTKLDQATSHVRVKTLYANESITIGSYQVVTTYDITLKSVEETSTPGSYRLSSQWFPKFSAGGWTFTLPTTISGVEIYKGCIVLSEEGTFTFPADTIFKGDTKDAVISGVSITLPSGSFEYSYNSFTKVVIFMQYA